MLRKIIRNEFEDILDKNIDEQLSLYEFNSEPIKKLDWETIQFIDKGFLTEESLEMNQNILKKVRQLHK